MNQLSVSSSSRSKRRVGRGMGSGRGKTCGRGHKGQKSRSGGYHRVGFEGGQMPLQRRLPKRGFHNPFKKFYTLIHLSDLGVFRGSVLVTPEMMVEKGLLEKSDLRVKLLGDGKIDHSLHIVVDMASKSAVSKMVSAGGKVSFRSSSKLEAKVT